MKNALPVLGISPCSLPNAGLRQQRRGSSLVIHVNRSPEPLGLELLYHFAREELTVDVPIGV